MSGKSWVCPHCERPVTITAKDIFETEVQLTEEKNAEGDHELFTRFIVCPNEKCRKFTIESELWNVILHRTLGWQKDKLVKSWQLVPESAAKTFPDYIPKAILEDYKEACLIKKLSPKAAATLARRCLQGMIRDFWKVKPGKLVNEIEEIKDQVDALSWDAITAVRKVGNIGAHMEKDVNLIIEVDNKEAELLISLVETLLQDWYVEKEEKEKRLSEIVRISEEKDVEKGKTEEEA